MEYHLSCAALSLLPFSKALESIPEAFDGWQIVAEGRHSLDMIAPEFKDSSHSYDLEYTVHAPTSDINIASLNKSIRLASVTETARCLREGANLGIRKYVIHPGRHSVLSSFDRERAFLLSRESIKVLSNLAVSLGVELFVENIAGKSAVAAAPKELRMLVTGTRAGICLDISHAVLEGQLDAFTAEEQSVGMLHLSDNDGVSDGHLRLGSGSIGVKGVLPFMRSLKLPVVIEGLTVEDCEAGRVLLESMP